MTKDIYTERRNSRKEKYDSFFIYFHISTTFHQITDNINCLFLAVNFNSFEDDLVAIFTKPYDSESHGKL